MVMLGDLVFVLVWEGPVLVLELVLGLAVLVEVLARIGAGGQGVVWLLVVGMSGCAAVLDNVGAVAAIHEDNTGVIQSCAVELDSSFHQEVIARLSFQDYWDSPGTFVVDAAPLAVAGGEAGEKRIVRLEASAAAAAAQQAFALVWEEVEEVSELLYWDKPCFELWKDRIPVVMEAQAVV